MVARTVPVSRPSWNAVSARMPPEVRNSLALRDRRWVSIIMRPIAASSRALPPRCTFCGQQFVGHAPAARATACRAGLQGVLEAGQFGLHLQDGAGGVVRADPLGARFGQRLGHAGRRRRDAAGRRNRRRAPAGSGRRSAAMPAFVELGERFRAALDRVRRRLADPLRVHQRVTGDLGLGRGDRRWRPSSATARRWSAGCRSTKVTSRMRSWRASDRWPISGSCSSCAASSGVPAARLRRMMPPRLSGLAASSAGASAAGGGAGSSRAAPRRPASGRIGYPAKSVRPRAPVCPLAKNPLTVSTRIPFQLPVPKV